MIRTREISRRVWNTVVVAWVAIEVGQFVELRLGLADNALFWPLWIAGCLIVYLGARFLDQQIVIRELRDQLQAHIKALRRWGS
jgi:hypothetical protein